MLVHDLLCSKQGIAAASGRIKDAILRHKTRLKADYVRAQLLRTEKTEGKFSYFSANDSLCPSVGQSEYIENFLR